MKWVLQTFEVRDLKHLSEENGHESKPFIKDWLDKFEKHPDAWKLIIKQMEANEDVQKASKEQLNKV